MIHNELNGDRVFKPYTCYFGGLIILENITWSFEPDTKMSNPSKKKKIRQGHRTYIANIIGNVNGIVGEYDPSQEVRLKQLKVTLQEKLDTLFE